MIIMPSFNLDELISSNNSIGIYVSDQELYIHRCHVSDHYRIVNLANAMLPSKTCLAYRIRKTEFADKASTISNWIKSNAGDDLIKLLDLLGYLDFDSCILKIFTLKLNKNIFVDRELLPSNKVFTPFRTLPPLKAIPDNWNMRHVYMALLNRQFSVLNFNSKYTQNYDEVQINYDLLAKDLVKDVMEHSSGWKTKIDRDGTIHVDYYSTNTNTFKLRI